MRLIFIISVNEPAGKIINRLPLFEVIGLRLFKSTSDTVVGHVLAKQ